jgi:hypothetical protein
VLKGAGVAVVAVAGGVVWRSVDQGVFSAGTGPAYEPWSTWREDIERSPLRLVRAAILAANPHNTQPWLFRVSGSRIDVHADTRRNIGAIDPYLREMYVGVGCALENLLIAAAHDGYATELRLMPDAGHQAHAARIELSPAAPAPSALHEAIPRRHTNRGSYDAARPVPQEVLSELAGIGADLPEVEVLWFASASERRRVGELIVAATEAIIADHQQSGDSAKWFRSSWQDVQRLRDGITLDAQTLPPFIGAMAKILPPVTQERADAAWLEATRERQVGSAAAFGLLAVPSVQDNGMRLRGGRMWQRMHLWATTQGLAMQPLNQMSERADRERQLGLRPKFGAALAELTDGGSSHALMLFRIGYPLSAGGASPRRDVKTVLL